MSKSGGGGWNGETGLGEMIKSRFYKISYISTAISFSMHMYIHVYICVNIYACIHSDREIMHETKRERFFLEQIFTELQPGVGK